MVKEDKLLDGAGLRLTLEKIGERIEDAIEPKAAVIFTTDKATYRLPVVGAITRTAATYAYNGSSRLSIGEWDELPEGFDDQPQAADEGDKSDSEETPDSGKEVTP